MAHFVRFVGYGEMRSKVYSSKVLFPCSSSTASLFSSSLRPCASYLTFEQNKLNGVSTVLFHLTVYMYPDTLI